MHILGRIKRGIGIFFLGFTLVWLTSFETPFPFSELVGLGYLAWVIYDILRIINLQNKQRLAKGAVG
jgi:hypothetical protein